MKVLNRALGRTLVVAGMLVAISSIVHAQDAGSCLHREDKGGRLHYENRCGHVVTLLYCSSGKPLFGRTCGAPGAGKSNAYYTHLRHVDAGASGDLPPGQDMRLAVCQGQFHEFDWRGFRAETDGSYTCPTSSQLTRASRPQLEARATRPDRASACAAAKALIAPGDVKDGDCVCKVSARATSCVAKGWMNEEQSKAAASGATGRELFGNRCAQAGQPEDCLKNLSPVGGSKRNGTQTGSPRG